MQQFANALKSTKKVVTLEISPPKGSSMALCLDRIRPLLGMVDAINIPDSQRAILKMSSMACSKIVQDTLGVDTVWQLTGRDRNALALQADLLGGWALGLQNVLALTGDPIQIGDQAEVAKQVGHLDSLRLIELVQALNNNHDLAGQELKHAGSQFCIGSALNPNRMSREAQVHRLAYKIKAGVDFFQTQPVYDVETVIETQRQITHLAEVQRTPKPKLLIGIIPPKTADFARFLNAKLPGVSIPESLIDLLDRTDDPARESIAYCADLVSQFYDEVDGFHFMPVGFEKKALQLLEACLQKI